MTAIQLSMTQEEVRELFDYRDGNLYWRYKTANNCRLDIPAGSVVREGPAQRRNISIKNKTIQAHLLVWLYHNPNLPEIILHKNGDRTDNRYSNLVGCTMQERNRNRYKFKNNTSGYKGVTLNKLTGRWTATIFIEDSNKYLGSFDTPEQAHAEYCNAADKYYKEYANYG